MNHEPKMNTTEFVDLKVFYTFYYLHFSVGRVLMIASPSETAEVSWASKLESLTVVLMPYRTDLFGCGWFLAKFVSLLFKKKKKKKKKTTQQFITRSLERRGSVAIWRSSSKPLMWWGTVLFFPWHHYAPAEDLAGWRNRSFNPVLIR